MPDPDPSNREFLKDFFPVNITGQTGSGKTPLGCQIADQHPLTSVFFNVQEDHRVRGVRCTSVEEVVKALSQGQDVDFVPSGDIQQEFERLLNALYQICKPPKLKNNQLLLVVDECQTVWPNGMVEHRGFTRSRGRGIKVIGLSQRAAQVSSGWLTQCRWHIWIGTPTDKGTDYLRDFGWDIEYLRGRQQYEVTVRRDGVGIVSGGWTVDPAYA